MNNIQLMRKSAEVIERKNQEIAENATKIGRLEEQNTILVKKLAEIDRKEKARDMVIDLIEKGHFRQDDMEAKIAEVLSSGKDLADVSSFVEGWIEKEASDGSIVGKSDVYISAEEKFAAAMSE